MKKIIILVDKLNPFFMSFVDILTRWTLGFVFIESGWGKFKDLGAVVAYFESLQIPFASVQAPFVSGVELVGGVFLILGLLTRVSSLLLAGTMVVALLTAKLEEITGLSDLLGLIEYLYLVLLLILASKPAGCFSVDYFLFKKFRKN